MNDRNQQRRDGLEQACRSLSIGLDVNTEACRISVQAPAGHIFAFDDAHVSSSIYEPRDEVSLASALAGMAEYVAHGLIECEESKSRYGCGHCDTVFEADAAARAADAAMDARRARP